jgi:hypothetical protein
MSEKKAKLLRKTQPAKPKQLSEPLMLNIGGKQTFIPRLERRRLMRTFRTMLRKGKIDMADLARRKAENDRKSKEQRQSI